MIGLDTNVIVRALVDDDPEQSAAARGLLCTLTPGNPGFVGLIVLVETIWVLRNTYHYSDQAIRGVVGRLLEAADLVIEQADLVRRALGVAQDTNRELPDILIALSADQAGCDKTITFDRRATSIPGMELLKVSGGFGTLAS